MVTAALSRSFPGRQDRPVRPESLASFFLEKNKIHLAVPGPPRISHVPKEPLARILQINVYCWAGQKEARKQSHGLLPTGGWSVASLFPAQ
jgi:hypothetical protein